MAIIIRRPHSDERGALHDLWLRSVRATHAFLTEEDIMFYAPMVAGALASGLESWAVYEGDCKPVGFMVLAGPDEADEPGGKWKLEALFIDPDRSRQGFGKTLVEYAVALKGPLTLDVNEQNPNAEAFYRHLGFTKTGRSPLDGAGRPFPLIHMEMP